MGQVAEFLADPGMGEPGSLAVPGEPHQTALGSAIWPNGGEVREQRSVQEVPVGGGRCRLWHRVDPWSGAERASSGDAGLTPWSAGRTLLARTPTVAARHPFDSDPGKGIMQRPIVVHRDRQRLYSYRK